MYVRLIAIEESGRAVRSWGEEERRLVRTTQRMLFLGTLQH